MPAVAINEYEMIREKMGETVSLPEEKLQTSEYNTRCTCIDQNHVNRLAKKIKERGFHPKRAISVNVIRGTNGSAVTYRVAAGVHRLAAAKAAELSDIPCLLYYDLTDEEECLLDRWDNEMDEDHKKIHFLEEAEHCKYLNEVKKWSHRQIGRNKGIDPMTVTRRIKIANIPEEAKKIIRGVDPDLHLFFEKYFLYICKLSNPHIINVCKEIVTKAELAEKGEKDRMGVPIRPMKQNDIEKRVRELLRIEKQGGREVKVREHVRQLHLFPHEDENYVEEEYCRERSEIVKVEEKDEEPRDERPIFMTPEPIPEMESEMIYRDQEKISRKMNMNRCVRWIKFAGLIREIGSTNYILLRDIVEYDLWYRSNLDEPFFFGEEAGGDPFAYFAEMAGVEKEHIQKRSLPNLKKEGFLDYWSENGIYWFKVNWDRLVEVYRKRAFAIHYKEDGLKGIPTDFSGVIRPTPFHYVRIEKGKPVPWNGYLPEGCKNTTENKNTTKAENSIQDDPLAKKLKALTPPMNDKEIARLCREKREESAIVLKLLEEKTDEQKKAIKSEAGYVLDLVKRREQLQLPKGFVTPEEAHNREENNNALNTFITIFKEKKYKKFCPNDKSCFTIIDYDDCGFSYEKEEGDYYYAQFEKWMDEKFFR